MKLQDTEQQPEDCDFGELNRLFHKNYEELVKAQRKTIENAEGNVLLRIDNRLALFKGEEIINFTINPDSYHEYKATSHLALATYGRAPCPPVHPG